MTRRDQMLDDFDALAAAELDDLAAVRHDGPARSVSTRPAVRARAASRPASTAWDWLVGACVLGLVVLAARR